MQSRDCIFNDNGLAIHCILDEYKRKMTIQVHPHECAIKMNLEEPAFTTNPPAGFLPVFLPIVVFNGAAYTSEVGKNKRDAEQLAARAAILSIIGILSKSFSTIF
ncbi:hypothetical protein Vadar_012987 [Vaccinium darrowii]|uniref:Uncharacterized protein n=1 Tax=Vaccinium darrowii TaxID=229202 RepID=A0ACB7YDJ8_9ERIC|nr:hypothetical protein Vadar_012987 [Vaccinium darrowii]